MQLILPEMPEFCYSLGCQRVLWFMKLVSSCAIYVCVCEWVRPAAVVAMLILVLCLRLGSGTVGLEWERVTCTGETL